MLVKRQKILSLLARQRNLYRQDKLYKSDRTGLAFCATSNTYDLDVNIKGSDDWKDWLGNASQLIMLIFGGVLYLLGAKIAGIILCCLAVSFNFSYLFAGIEAYKALKNMVYIASHNNIYVYGHSRGGPIGFYLLILLKIFHRKTNSCLITTGSPRPVRNLNPISWVVKSCLHFVNKLDLVPKSQPWWLGYFKHPGKTQFVEDFGKSIIEFHELEMYEHRIREESEEFYIL